MNQLYQTPDACWKRFAGRSASSEETVNPLLPLSLEHSCVCVTEVMHGHTDLTAKRVATEEAVESVIRSQSDEVLVL